MSCSTQLQNSAPKPSTTRRSPVCEPYGRADRVAPCRGRSVPPGTSGRHGGETPRGPRDIAKSVADAMTGIMKRCRPDRNEPVVPTTRMERQRHNTEDLVLMNAAILPDLTETGVKGTTSADHHLLDSAFRLPFPGRALPSENLKGVRVARGVDIHVRLVHEFDQWTDVGTGEAIRTPPRSMPEYQGASVAVSGKVGLQPLVLRRSDRTASPVADPGALRVYRDDMPGPDVKAVIAWQ